MSLTRLIVLAAVLTWGVVTLGAYVRLSDAGLGCPDWPGCYGHLGVPSSAEQQQAALAAFPDRPVEAHKAWKEMVHRYAAGTLGMLILAIFIRAWRQKDGPRFLSAVLLALVLFQALLGRWTVTELLRPTIVTAHLLGGMATLALLVWLSLGQERFSSNNVPAGTGRRLWAALGIVVIVGQIALGGWTSAHYAALACGNELTCRGVWIPAMDFTSGFSFSGSGIASAETLTAIHWSHRLGALAVAGILAPFAIGLLQDSGLRGFGWLLLALLAAQIGLGIANIALGLPLIAAVLHNAVAALLLVVMVALNWKFHGKRSLP